VRGCHEPRLAAAAALATAVVLAGCAGSAHRSTRDSATTTLRTTPATAAPLLTTLPVASTTSVASPIVRPTTTEPAATSTTSTTAAGSGFVSSIATVAATELGRSYHVGCPVGPAELRRVQVGYWGFDQTRHVGSIVVHRDVATTVSEVFRDLFVARFPIRMLRPIDAFGGDDNTSMAADNTSGFNCRLAVASGPPRWSAHSYGKAIDVNPRENPYLEAGVVRPPGGAAYLRRGDLQPGMAGLRTAVNAAFARVGWLWGGRWNATPDYQHFSATGG
jgi:hypothetical protein